MQVVMLKNESVNHIIYCNKYLIGSLFCYGAVPQGDLIMDCTLSVCPSIRPVPAYVSE